MIAVQSRYPESERETVVELLHGVSVEDPYRWLEDQESSRTRRWITDQTAYTRSYFEKLPARYLIRERIAELLSVETYDRPIEIAGRTFFLRRAAQQEQPCIVTRTNADSDEQVLVDPELRGEGSTVAVQILAVSPDARILAYGVKHGGEDKRLVEFLDVKTRAVLKDRLPHGTVRGLAFTRDGAVVIYSHRADSESDSDFCIRRHQLGESFANDEIILQIPYEPGIKGVGVLASGGPVLMFLVSRFAGKTTISDLYLYDTAHGREPRLFMRGAEASFGPRLLADRVFALTTDGAPNGRIVEVSLTSGEWTEVIPETSSRIKNFAVADQRVYLVYANDDRTPLEVYTVDGCRLPPPEFPPGTITNLWSYPGSEAIFLEYTSFTCPRTVYRIDSKSITLWSRRQVPFNPSGIQVQRVWLRSKDSTRVPMFLIGKGCDPRHRPTVLSAYGGFGTSITPQFTAYGTFLIEQGCTIAIANIRGGSEFGAVWHEAAKREKRQNAFDDFFAAAEWLINSGYTTPGQLGIVGGSNAGLLVGVAVTARPNLFRAAVCLGPLLDMLRYHRFGNARFWIDEYGCADDPGDFHHLYAYSPYHCAREGEAYPAVLFISGDQDKRCDAAHARKMTARLQQANASEYPVLLDYQTFRGHSPVLPLQVRIEGLTDRLAFLCDQLGIDVNGRRKEEI